MTKMIKIFDDSILRIIEEADQEVFIVAGSRHEFLKKEGQVVEAWNRAKIYANSKLANLDRAKDSPIVFPINQEKIVSAQKAGEYINVPTPSRISYYESKIGRIGVLICVDAYSPNVIFSLLNQRDMGSPEKLDYILVPAFNMSRKLYYACQVLSLTCQTVVVLVDACKHSRRKKTRLALFVGGRVFFRCSERSDL